MKNLFIHLQLRFIVHISQTNDSAVDVISLTPKLDGIVIGSIFVSLCTYFDTFFIPKLGISPNAKYIFWHTSLTISTSYMVLSLLQPSTDLICYHIFYKACSLYAQTLNGKGSFHGAHVHSILASISILDLFFPLTSAHIAGINDASAFLAPRRRPDYEIGTWFDFCLVIE